MDPHTILDVAPDAELSEIRQAYKKMALKWHPDRQTNITDDSRNTFAKINIAYQTLIRDLHGPPDRLQNRPMRSPPPSIHSMDSFSPCDLFTPQPSAMSSQTTPSSSFGGSSAPRSASSNNPSHPVRNGKGLGANDNAVRNGRVGYLTNGLTTQPLSAHPQHVRPSALKQPPGSVPVSQRKGNAIPLSKQLKFTRVIPMYGSDITGSSELLRPGPPLQPIGTGPSGEWSYPLCLTLEEFFNGKCCQFGIVRRYLSGDLDSVMVEVDIPPGCQTGSVVLSSGIGHELPDGTFDDISFVLQEVPHERFARLHSDLLLEIQVPWTEALRWRPKKVYVRGIDGEDIFVYVDYSRDKNLVGSLSVRGAGMPVRERGKLFGRGNMIVNWEIMPTPTKMRTFVRRLLRRET